MTAARARSPRAPAQAVAHTLVERREHTPRTRSRWTLALLETTAYGSRTLATWTGIGPLGRMRAHRDAGEFCARHSITPTEQLDDQRKPSSVRAWEFARLFARLADEGVLPPDLERGRERAG